MKLSFSQNISNETFMATLCHMTSVLSADLLQHNITIMYHFLLYNNLLMGYTVSQIRNVVCGKLRV